MERFGFIHGELDIKILILYILRRLPRPVEAEALTELTRSCDDCVGYFDYAQCLSELCDTGHVDELPGARYFITDKGKRNGETTETGIPYSVRQKAERLIEPVAAAMRRDAMINAGHTVADGECKVLLSLSDGKGEILSISILMPDEPSAESAEKAFRRDAESIYSSITNILLGNK